MLVAVVQHSDFVSLSALLTDANSVDHFVVAVLVAVIQR